MMQDFYQNNVQKAKQELALLEKQINRNSLFRLIVIIGGGAVLFKVFQTNNIGLLLLVVFTIVFVFATLVRRQSRLEKKSDETKAFLRVNENEIQVATGQPNIYLGGVEYLDGKHPYASDLDVFGPHSLFEKINRAATTEGVGRLANWLASASDKDTILRRQEASRELADKRTWTQMLQTKLLFNLGQKVNIKTFLQRYLQDEAFRFGNAFMRFYVPIAPFLLLAGVLFSLFVLPIWNILLLLAIVHLLWTLFLAGKVSYFSSRIDKIGATLIAYSDAIEMIEEEQFSAELNQILQEELRTADNQKLSRAFKSLGLLVDKLDARNNILIGAILNMIFLWDFKQVIAIQKWKRSYEGNVLHTFDVIADFEALLSLATLRNNHPTWCDPVILDDPREDRLQVRAVNHPLIPAGQAVENDYSAADHRVALVTGSNMAGKSTFLRTIGVNAVLAYAGGVVCADYFSVPIYRLVTYMRIKDDLNESTSTFKAELDRMKFILGVVELATDSFFLIDEMLRGTNSVDKYLGSRAIIKKLVGMKGKGMVATHDLQLSTLEEEYPELIKNYHFDIQVQHGEMLFDYKLKHGKCTVFNASMLLKGIGIEVSS